MSRSAINYDLEIEEIEDEVDKKFKQIKNFNMSITNKHKQSVSCKYCCARSSSDDRIMEERELLEHNLPENIFVWTNDFRFDLLRVCVVGLEGTPFCHCPFFFEIVLHTYYPSQPPEIFHHIFGYDLIPYLHKDGKVQLTQKWNMGRSNILEILIWIEKMISTGNRDKPLKSKNDVFMLSCESITYMLKEVQYCGSEFQDFVKGHFRKRAHNILWIYKEQILGQNSFSSDEYEEMVKIFFKLVEAFEENGSYCYHHYSKMDYEKYLKGDDEDEYLLGGKMLTRKFKAW